MPHVIIGTAGHIDHGKTALVKALTGIDTDRLKEEKERGLTIDLGFAPYGEDASIIDVPGHEKFIRNMVAGVSTIDLVVLVVAADDGIMPQTREHLEILDVLQVKQGIIAITKSDLVEPDWLQLVTDDIRDMVKNTFLEAAPIIPVSAVTHEGIPTLHEAIQSILKSIQRKQVNGVFWMPVDRSFVMKGFGTVVTGSVLSGTVQVGEAIELLPAKQSVKIRGLQRHGQTVDHVSAGDRAAINLQGVSKQIVQRGHVLASPGYFKPTSRMDAKLRLLASAPRSLTSRMRVRLHVGTEEVMARVSIVQKSEIEPGESAFVQLHLENPVAAKRLDAFVVRQFSPTITLGGGVILDVNAPRHKLSHPETVAIFEALQQESPVKVLEEKLLAAGLLLPSEEKLSAELGIVKDELIKYLDELATEQRIHPIRKKGQTAFLHHTHLLQTEQSIEALLDDFHRKNPTKTGMQKPLLLKNLNRKIDPAAFDFMLGDMQHKGILQEQSGIIHLKNFRVKLTAKQQNLRQEISNCLLREGFSTSSEKELANKNGVGLQEVTEILQLMLEQQEIMRLDGLYFHAAKIQEAREKLVAFLQQHEEVSIAAFKELLGGTSRKYSMPLLNYFDSLGITERAGDVRVAGSSIVESN